MRRFLFILIAVMLAGCAAQPQPQTVPASTPTVASPTGFDTGNLDRTANACTDFYQFANGGWLKTHPIPAAYSRWGNFSIVDINNQQKMRAILEEAANAHAPMGSDQQKVGDYYASCMDEKAIARAGVDPIRDDLVRINAVRSTTDLPQILARLHSFRIPVVFAFQSTQDFKNTEQVVASISQAGLGLPDRDYYTKDDPKSIEIRVRYVLHIARMLQLLGADQNDAQSQARNIMDFETRLAQASMTNVQLRDPVATYNKMTTTELHALAPSFSWPEYFAAVGVPAIQSLVIGQPEFVRELERRINTTPIDTWKSYLRWNLINYQASKLPKEFEEADFDFYRRYLEGTKEMLPRWKRCTAATDAALGEALGRLWTQRYFPESAKARALDMVHNITRALREDITTLAWMSPATRQQALAKLDAFGLKIGYPEKWRDYTAAAISKQPYVTNALVANHFEFHRDTNKIDKPVDRTEWLMTPPTVNAYNNPPMNEIVFPAGILQPPFYDPNADEAYNYGGMGAVIGHEIIHGFDDQGRQFDLRGNLTDWWTAEDKQRFLERAKCVSEQFSSYEIGGEHMTGDLVLGESIADLGGLQIAYAAYQKSQEGKPRKIVDGFTPEQRFFLGWAQVWAENMRKEAERLQITTDPHPLARFRVNGPLSNMPEFAAAFGCKTADPMVRGDDKRCNVWGTMPASTTSAGSSSR
ncbi:MAG TPA: M13 family metallopeptidase [Thermoanaerobaculia bacterium]|jgi:putative endopeptidase|nr:M13 family metallopeptidase [Thermoanaerobaculia bacterium]